MPVSHIFTKNLTWEQIEMHPLKILQNVCKVFIQNAIRKFKIR